VAAWYLTKEGRADFGKRAAERDRDWWKEASMWVGVEDDHDPVMVEACENILRQCPRWGETLREYAQGRLEPTWRVRDDDFEPFRRIEFDHLRRMEVEAVIGEAMAALRERDYVQNHLQLTLPL
jgi:hypothetical protein